MRNGLQQNKEHERLPKKGILKQKQQMKDVQNQTLIIQWECNRRFIAHSILVNSHLHPLIQAICGMYQFQVFNSSQVMHHGPHPTFPPSMDAIVVGPAFRDSPKAATKNTRRKINRTPFLSLFTSFQSPTFKIINLRQ
jgi:hypothetical protein